MLCRAVVPAARLGRFHQTVGQPVAAVQGARHPVVGADRALLGEFLAIPACCEPFAEHRLVGLSAGETLQRPPVQVAITTDCGDGSVPVTDHLREATALAVEADHVVR